MEKYEENWSRSQGAKIWGESWTPMAFGNAHNNDDDVKWGLDPMVAPVYGVQADIEELQWLPLTQACILMLDVSESELSVKMRSDHGLGVDLWEHHIYNIPQDVEQVLYFLVTQQCKMVYNKGTTTNEV